jgi:PIN domain nuclease of toxin-antitoxin system
MNPTSQKARDIFQNPENEVFLSSVSVWEIMVKNSIGKLSLPDEPENFVCLKRRQHGIETLSLTEQAVFHLKKLPKHHQDPFDRMLICQALEYNLTILTPDDKIAQYPVCTTW